MFSKQLNKKLDKYHLLNHPFYKSWNDGKLTREIIIKNIIHLPSPTLDLKREEIIITNLKTIPVKIQILIVLKKLFIRL